MTVDSRPASSEAVAGASTHDLAEARLFEGRARSVAQQHLAVDDGKPTGVLSYLGAISLFLKQARQNLAQADSDDIANPYAAEWLLDNYHVIDRSTAQIAEDMPPGYYRQLPRLKNTPLAGYPRAYAVARAMIRQCDAQLDLEWARRFLHAYQTVTPLTTGELWALPVMWRLTTIEVLARAVALSTDSPPPPTPEPDSPLPESIPPETLVANSILNLRALAVEDWKVFIEEVSLVDTTLRNDPAGVYAGMDFETRDRYRGVVEDLARGTHHPEVEIAQRAMELAQTAGGDNDGSASRTGHVGYYLIDDGRRQLEQAIGYRPVWYQRILRALRSRPTATYLGSIGGVSLAVLLALLRYGADAGAGLPRLLLLALVLIVPSVTLGVSAINWLIHHVAPPRTLPKLALEAGVPVELASMVVVPALLSGHDEVESLVGQMEQHYLQNPGENLHFALLTDFSDAATAHRPEDESLLEHARNAIGRLNATYRRNTPGPFYLFHRHRSWNASEAAWMGWERKRGKLEELNGLLLGRGTRSDTVLEGDFADLPPIRYVITLDADTLMPQGSASRLIGTLAHPLNRVEFDSRSGHVLRGYTVLQPRTEVKPSSANRSLFSRISAGDTGLDLYTHAVSDVYQDWFGEGIFVGKGIYDLAGFDRSLAGRVPENTLLSHDLFEGLQGRAGLVTDVVLYEEYPSGYLESAHRMHRWIRGDWQLLPWLFGRLWGPTVAGGAAHLSAIDRWKIADNLRRSLLSPTTLLLLAVGWLGIAGSPLVWTLVALLTLAFPVLTSLVTSLARREDEVSIRETLSSARMPILRWLLQILFLPHQAFIAVDAISATLVRLLITHRRMLQWTTAAHTAKLFGRDLRVGVSWRVMSAAPLLAAGLTAIVSLVNRSGVAVAAPFLVAWFMSPQLAHWISMPITHEPETLSEEQQTRLRLLARRTWSYFEQFAGPNEHWLPPDHFQESPRGVVDGRTSPTNIGLLMLSAVGAYDLGYVSPMELVARLGNTVATVDGLENHRGHLLNWYDTRTLASLPTRYVSTVDSGNYVACILTVRQALLDLPRAPVLRWQHWQGVLDTLAVLAETVSAFSTTSTDAVAAVLEHLEVVRADIIATRGHPERRAATLARLLGDHRARLDQLLLQLVDAGGNLMDAAALRDLRAWAARAHYQMGVMQRERHDLVPWLQLWESRPQILPALPAGSRALQLWSNLVESLPASPKLDEIESICVAARERLDQLLKGLRQHSLGGAELEAACVWCESLAPMLDTAQRRAADLLEEAAALAARLGDIAEATDFGFLYDERRGVFHIGYNVDAGRLDPNYYDLLASESRIASVIAIGTGDVPARHWLRLGRPLTQVDNMRALLSWSGTMFEYLMPLLIMRQYDNTLLQQSCQAAVQRQIEYGARRRVPWGISESGFYQIDDSRNYQYRAFGVPGLGLKRGLDEDLVIAPYASLLALPLRPQAVLDNIDHLERLGMRGHYGLYEAIDFTPSRMVPGEQQGIVRSFMAHHQGMILLSVANYLEGNAIVRRFHQDQRVRSVELLLQERIPTQVPLQELPEEAAHRPASALPTVDTSPWMVPPRAPSPQLRVLSNGHYTVMATAAGGGYSRWRDTDLTRWRADTTLENYGTWIYLQDLDSGELWSATEQPVPGVASARSTYFSPHMADYRTNAYGIDTRVDLTIAPDDDIEIRRVRITNGSEERRRLFVASYAEVILAPQDTDRRHPAFNGLFIESRFRPDVNALFFTRRPRSTEESPPHLVHALVLEPGHPATGAHETDRARFLGRGGSLRRPAALLGPEPKLSGTVGAVLDPIMSLGQVVELGPHSSIEMAFLTGAAESRRRVTRLAERYYSWSEIERARSRARGHSELELRQLKLGRQELINAQALLSLLFYPYPAMRGDEEALSRNTEGQSHLWPYAISGDYPILLVRIGNEEELALVAEMLRLHSYWRNKGLQIDLVILDEKESGYAQELRGRLHRLLENNGSETWLNRRGGIFLVQEESMSPADRLLLVTAARVVLDGSAGGLEQQLAGVMAAPNRLPLFVPMPSDVATDTGTPAVERPKNLRFDNGLGGFSLDGREYVIYLEPGESSPAPWVNVIANEEFGFLVSEAGSSYSWAVNSGENRLTPWSNDPVLDPAGEALYLRDEETAAVWSPTRLPAGEKAPYLVRHGAGYSVFEHNSHGLNQRVRMFAAVDAPVKLVQVRLENLWKQNRRITATYYAEWVLGVNRDATQQYIIPAYDAERRAILARNPYNSEFGSRVAFLASSLDPHGLTTDRTEFLGRLGDRRWPAALGRIGLSGHVAAGGDPCAAIQVHLDLAPGEVAEFHFLLGQGADREETLSVMDRHRDREQVETAWQAVLAQWDSLLGSVIVATPEPAMDLMLNQWLLYQSLACRIWGRSGFYQSSGAYGFRDQLQDVLAWVHAAPELTRKQILRAAAHQFEAGDVLHWWHPPSGRGVRTRITDDLLWLPYVTAAYIEATGDRSVLAEPVPYLRGEPLAPREEERYGQYETTEESATIYEHCCAAIRRASTTGRHGLPLMGGGDWNDGMNRVGIGGRGESVWLGWFLYATLTDFIPVCQAMGEPATADLWLRQAEELKQALHRSGWDGDWYRRAYYDDGTPMGSKDSLECQIDSISQSWAVLSGAGDSERVSRAMEAAGARLVRPDERLVLLLEPPFDRTPHDPGYIKGYPPGVRENGGQYTHGAIWLASAYAALGQGNQAELLYQLLNPIHHSDSPEKAVHYRGEAYVVAADVYGVPPHTGRAGWTWYTGSAAWLYRLGLEDILGLRRRGDNLSIRPCLPDHWPGYSITYRYQSAVYNIRVDNPDNVSTGVRSVTVDGEAVAGAEWPLRDDGREHVVEVLMG